jgi:hypothetical protein
MKKRTPDNFFKYFFSFGICLLLLAGTQSCIPIEDRLLPILTVEEPQKYFYWQDTLAFNAVATDNDRIAEVIVNIEPKDAQSMWRAERKINANGRKFDIKFREIVPFHALAGTYRITITCRDSKKNQATYAYDIEILGDIRAPSFIDLMPINLEEYNESQYSACRSQTVLFEGTLKDNSELSSLTVEFEAYPRIVYNLNGKDSIDIGKTVGEDIRVPQAALNGSTLILNFIAVDKDGNQSRKSFEIYVDCDDEPPVLTLTATEPAFSENRVTVIQGTDLLITEAVAQDNIYLSDLVILFNKRGAEPDTVFYETLDSDVPVDIEELFGEIALTMPADATPGDRYDFYMYVTDSSDLKSNVVYLEVITGRDEPPLMLITNTEINDAEKNWKTTEQNIVAPGDKLRFDGKILEDVALEYVKISFGLAASPELKADLTADDLEGKLPFNFADLVSVNEFEIPQRNPVSPYDLYSITIEAKDRKNAPVKVVYLFKVLQ